MFHACTTVVGEMWRLIHHQKTDRYRTMWVYTKTYKLYRTRHQKCKINHMGEKCQRFWHYRAGTEPAVVCKQGCEICLEV
jgi:hypothetical protein